MASGPANPSQDDFTKLRRTPGALSAWQAALHDLNNGRHAAAMAAYSDLVRQFPGVPQLWAELGMAAAGDLEFAQAAQAFDRAVELAAADAELLIYISWQFFHLRQLDRAFECVKKAVANVPSSMPARLTMAFWWERTRRLDQAMECIDDCLKLDLRNTEALYFKAFLFHRKGMETEAETALRDLLKFERLQFDLQINANHLLGEVFDSLGNYSEALMYLTRSKALRRKDPEIPRMEQYYEQMNRARVQLLSSLKPEIIRRWREEAGPAPGGQSPALLGGAARSGTTLIEQILGAHPEILIFDESASFGREVFDPLNASHSQGLTLEYLDGLASGERTRLTARYLKSLLRETTENTQSRLLLDKNPGTTAALHVWLRFLPFSKIIIALRDPRDVIVSCYFQNFPIRWSIVGFLSLEGTARYYSDLMDTWLRLRELGGFDWVETRYEDIVANLPQEARRVTQFLGLQWRETQANFHQAAEARFVHSPTYSQVSQPIYNRAVGRWKNYAEAIAPLQPGLERYLRALGYG